VTEEISLSRTSSHYDKEKLIHFLDGKWKGSKKCPICEINNWSLSRHILQLDNMIELIEHERAIVPAIALACTNCGYTMFFNPIEMGIFMDIFERPQFGRIEKGVTYTTQKEGN